MMEAAKGAFCRRVDPGGFAHSRQVSSFFRWENPMTFGIAYRTSGIIYWSPKTNHK